MALTMVSAGHRTPSTAEQEAQARWSGRRESNPRLLLGRQGHYHYATPALVSVGRPLRKDGARPFRDTRRSLVGRAGFEPAYRFREPNLQSGAINHSTTDPGWGPAEIRAPRVPFLPFEAARRRWSRGRAVPDEEKPERADVAQW